MHFRCPPFRFPGYSQDRHQASSQFRPQKAANESPIWHASLVQTIVFVVSDWRVGDRESDAELPRSGMRARSSFWSPKLSSRFAPECQTIFSRLAESISASSRAQDSAV